MCYEQMYFFYSSARFFLQLTPASLYKYVGWYDRLSVIYWSERALYLATTSLATCGCEPSACDRRRRGSDATPLGLDGRPTFGKRDAMGGAL